MTDAPTDALQYPYAATPEPGAVTEVAPGLLWARMPLPFRLNHVNVWLLEDEDGWTVIDTGCATPDIYACWEALLAGPMGGKPVSKIIATHGHVDHIGLSGWLHERFGCDYVSTFAEWIWSRISHTRDVPGSMDEHRRFLIRHGFDATDAERMAESRHTFMDLATTIPPAIVEIRDGETIHFGGRDWTIIVTRGHAFEHAGFYCEADNILIAGDHLLPKISPVIAVYEMAPDADPLGDYLASFSQFAGVAADALVLPSHGLPYYGVHTRIGELQAHHDERLDETLNLLSEPMNALDLSAAMFPHIDGPENIGFALGEVLAHVNRLLHSGHLTQCRLEDGTIAFARADA